MAAPDDLRERLAVIESRIAEFGDETRRVRDRLHDVENDRMAVQLLAQQVKTLERDLQERVVDLIQRLAEVVHKVDALPATINSAATRAGKDAVREALATRDESKAKRWANWIALGVACIAFAGLIIQAIATIANGT